MKIGYARVSSDDQNLALQLDALRKTAGASSLNGLLSKPSKKESA